MPRNMRIATLSVLAPLILGLATAPRAQAQQSQGRSMDSSDPTKKASIEGRIVLSSGHPVDSRVRIKLSSLRDAGIDLYTDNNGAFQYLDLQPGTYTVEVMDDDSHRGTAKEQVSLLAGQRVSLMIYLKTEEESKKAGKSGVTDAETLKPAPPKARQEYITATNLASNGDFVSAINHYNNALKIFPDYLDAHNDLGVVFLKLKRIDEASEQFEAAVQISPKAFNPRLNLGIILLGKRKYPEAVDQLTQCVSIDSSQASGHLYLGIASLGQDDLSQAKRELTSALDIGGEKFSAGHYYMAYVLLKSGDRPGAIKELETFLTVAPDDKQLGSQASALLTKLKQ